MLMCAGEKEKKADGNRQDDSEGHCIVYYDLTWHKIFYGQRVQ